MKVKPGLAAAFYVTWPGIRSDIFYSSRAQKETDNQIDKQSSRQRVLLTGHRQRMDLSLTVCWVEWRCTWTTVPAWLGQGRSVTEWCFVSELQGIHRPTVIQPHIQLSVETVLWIDCGSASQATSVRWGYGEGHSPFTRGQAQGLTVAFLVFLKITDKIASKGAILTPQPLEWKLR